jgi:hypothetical protein
MPFRDTSRSYDAPHRRGAKLHASALMRVLVLLAIWQMVGPASAYSNFSVSGPSFATYNAVAGSDAQSTLLTDSGIDGDSVDDELHLQAVWLPQTIKTGGVAFHLPLITSTLLVIDDLRGPTGRTESPPVPPPLPRL